MTIFKSNTSGEEIVVDVSTERDQGIFLTMSGNWAADGQVAFDCIIEDPGEIEDFFKTVEEARVHWLRLSMGRG